MNDFSRYHRQMLLPTIGEEGQRALAESAVLVAGCGALGTVAADLLARAGVGTLVIVDRDIVEHTNLQRQTLFTERDAQRGMPKAEAAKTKLSLVNSDVRVRAFVEDIAPDTIVELAADCDLLLDGLDNFQTRYLLNDYAVAHGVPYVYGAAVATTGMSMPVLPVGGGMRRVHWKEEESTPCLRCMFPEPPPAGASETCDTAGVLGSVTATIAAHQVTQVIKILVGEMESVDRTLLSIDMWKNEFRRMDIGRARNSECPCCMGKVFDFLHADIGDGLTVLCGQNAVQVRPSTRQQIDLEAMRVRLAAHGSFLEQDGALRGIFGAEISPDALQVELTLFPDGRAIVSGSTDPAWARGVYDRFIGH